MLRTETFNNAGKRIQIDITLSDYDLVSADVDKSMRKINLIFRELKPLKEKLLIDFKKLSQDDKNRFIRQAPVLHESFPIEWIRE